MDTDLLTMIFLRSLLTCLLWRSQGIFRPSPPCVWNQEQVISSGPTIPNSEHPNNAGNSFFPHSKWKSCSQAACKLNLPSIAYLPTTSHIKHGRLQFSSAHLVHRLQISASYAPITCKHNYSLPLCTCKGSYRHWRWHGEVCQSSDVFTGDAANQHYKVLFEFSDIILCWQKCWWRHGG